MTDVIRDPKTTKRTTTTTETVVTEETGRRPTVRFTKDTQVTFSTRKGQPVIPPARSLAELASRMHGVNNLNERVELTREQAARFLKSQGYTFNEYTWGLESAEFNQAVVLSMYVEGKDMVRIQAWLGTRGVVKSDAAIYQWLRKVLDVDAEIEGDIPPGSIEMHRCHSPKLHKTQYGGLACRYDTVGVYRPRAVNLRLSRLSVSLNFTEAMILVLYGDIIETHRPYWILTHHYATYGRRSFKAILKKFYPMLLNTLIKTGV